jgi:hypothetical protein
MPYSKTSAGFQKLSSYTNPVLKYKNESAEKSSRKDAKAQSFSREKPVTLTLSEFFQWNHIMIFIRSK